MSQAHIPQPTAESAPAEVFESTQAAPHTTTVSGIGNSGAPPAEITQHTLAHNNIDNYFYTQFIFLDKFTWTTQNVAGTMLWSMPLHPRAFCKELAYLSAIYNTWGGGIEINFKIAGTGFHAGALAFARIPPNIDPSTLGSDYGYTKFEYKVMDAKTLEVDTVHIGDQRQVNYHYMVGDPKDPKSWDIGGTVACYVWAGLNTAATSTQAIQVVISMRLAPEFRFNQIRNLTIESQENDQKIPTSTEYMFNNISRGTASADRFTSVTHLKVLPSTIKKLDIQFSPSAQGDGPYRKSITGYAQTSTYYREWTRCLVSNADNGEFRFKLTNDNEAYFAQQKDFSIMQYNRLVICNTKANNVKPSIIANLSSSVYNSQIKDFVMKLDTKMPDGWATDDELLVCPQFPFKDISKGMPDQVMEETPVPALSESFIVFGRSDNYTSGSVQTYSMLREFQRNTLNSWLATGEAALFAVVDKNEQTPLFYVKLYREGYLTARPSTSMLKFDLGSLKLVFQNTIRTTTEIPASGPNMPSSNRAVFASLHKHASRENERSQPNKEQMNIIGSLGGAMAGAGLNFGTLSPFAQNQQNYANQSKLSKQNYEQQRGLNQQNYDLSTGAFTKYGLPEYMANFNGNQPQNTVQHLRGLNYATTAPMFSRGAPSNPNPHQQMKGWANYGNQTTVKNKFNDVPQPQSEAFGANAPPPLSNGQSPFFNSPSPRGAGRGGLGSGFNVPDYMPNDFLTNPGPGAFSPISQDYNRRAQVANYH
ncbi:hypothetical protein 2 [Hubei picorna-like virus 71]|uniref:hypothetical protein 2 n=1 Tax=Hubei picorna-like virus 71 TaxID=1923155 RepID=UPI00090B5B78|nr:hypothetical protein 2 [Hubei picorna-like virus 71]APG77432.1 hypothetical protein 2 [Hubei picorna-like virus 71]